MLRIWTVSEVTDTFSPGDLVVNIRINAHMP